MDLTHPDIHNYLEALLPARHPVMLEMEAEAERTGFPHVGPQVGSLLEVLARSVGARTVFELGSGFGYSAAWFARALPTGGKVILTDRDYENLARAREYFRRLELDDRMETFQGDALEALARNEGPLDIVFSDIDKEEYPRVIEMAHERLRPGGLLITDNALWHGKVVQGDVDAATEAVRRFNRELMAHPGFSTVILPLRDGVAVASKRTRPLLKPLSPEDSDTASEDTERTAR